MSITYAVDFDDFISQCDHTGQAPTIENKPNGSVVSWMKRCRKKNIALVVHTSRSVEERADIAKYLNHYEIPFTRIMCNKVSADKYFGNNYFNTALNLKLDAVQEKAQGEYFNVLRNYRDEVYHSMSGLEEDSAIAYLVSQLCDLHVTSDKGSTNIYLAGSGTSHPIAETLAIRLNTELGSDSRLHAEHLGFNPVFLNSEQMKTYYKDLLITKSKYINSGKAKKNAAIIFDAQGDDPMMKELVMELSTRGRMRTTVITGSSEGAAMLEEFDNVKTILIKSDNPFIIDLGFHAFANLLINVLKRFYTGSLKLTSKSFLGG